MCRLIRKSYALFFTPKHNCLLGLALLLLVSPSARAQRLVLSFYSGNTFTKPSDVHIIQPSTNSDFTIRGMRFDSHWSREAPYYGTRLGTWFSGNSSVGTDLEFRHHKMFGRVNALRPLDGLIQGKSIHGVEKVDRFVRDFRLTDGVNTLATNLYLRESLGGAGHYERGAAQGYTAVGAPYYITYAHANVNGVAHPKGGYRGIGSGLHFFVGLRYGITDRFGVFGEIGYSEARKKTVEIGQGGTATLDIRTFHYNGGISYTLLE